MKPHSPAVHHTILVTDIEKYTDPARTNLDQLAIRDGQYKIIRRACARAHVDWNGCTTEDRGDGVLILVPSDVPKIRLATSMLTQLGNALLRRNASCSTRTRIRLRIALHAGEVHYDNHGVAGRAINHTFRLAETPVLKAALHASPGPIAIIVSDWFYEEVIRHYPAAEPDSYLQVPAATSRTASGWIRVPAATPRVEASSRCQSGTQRDVACLLGRECHVAFHPGDAAR